MECNNVKLVTRFGDCPDSVNFWWLKVTGPAAAITAIDVTNDASGIA